MNCLSRLTVTLLAAALLLAACGERQAAEEAPAPTAAPVEATEAPDADPTESAPAPTTVPEDDASDEAAATPETAPEEANELFTDEASLIVAEETDDTRVIRHSYGETEILTDPQRIVVIQDQNLLLPILELGQGARVVGSAGATREDGTPFFRRTQDYDTSDVTMIGGVFEPNLEVIAELNPDLIIDYQIRMTQDDYDLFSEIAATVVVELATRPIWGFLFDIALLVNAQDVAIAQKAAYDERVATIQPVLEEPSNIDVFVTTTREDGSFLADTDLYSTHSTVITDLDLSITPLWQETIQSGEAAWVSLEELPLLESDGLYIFDRDGSSAVLTESPLYATLEVVQKGQAHVVDSSTHAGFSVQALNAWLDTFEETLLVDSFDTSWAPPE